eukprot:2115572-Amphidinium_carterae.1
MSTIRSKSVATVPWCPHPLLPLFPASKNHQKTFTGIWGVQGLKPRQACLARRVLAGFPLNVVKSEDISVQR